jgi:hypothetical protein
MAVQFRCEKCGKLLNLEAEPGQKVKCPYCHAKVTTPAGVASLPRPQVPAGAAAAGAGAASASAGSAAPPPPPPRQQEEQEQEAYAPDPLMDIMAKVMPWVTSLFLHAGIAVILGFITIVVYTKTTDAEGVMVPDAQLSPNPGGKINPGKVSRNLSSQVQSSDWAKRDTTISAEGQTESKIKLYGNTGGSSGAAAGGFGLTSGGQGKGPRAPFMGMGGNAHHVVLVVDKSGSMLDYFDLVKREMYKTIAKLQDVQTFHVVLFEQGLGDEATPRRLVPATVQNKNDAFRFLKKVQPSGGSPTNPLPALKRAFEVLRNPPTNQPGKLVYLLTDGEFHDNEEVRRRIKQWNADGDVMVNTILYATGGGDIERVLRAIAQENGGKFKKVRYEG